VTDLMWLWLVGCTLVVGFFWLANAPARRRARLSKWSRRMHYAGKRP
jgi:hypothetical protein